MKPYLLLFFLLSTTTLAYEPDRAMSNLASEFAECSAYYTLSSKAIKTTSTQAKTPAETMSVALEFFKYSSGLSNAKVAAARLQMFQKDMLEELDGSWSNFAILINKYNDFCIQLFNEPDERVNYWLSKK